MVDVQVSPESPKPCLFYPTELAVLSPRFIAQDISSFNRNFSFPESTRDSLRHCDPFVDSNSSTYPQSRSSLKRLRSQSLSSVYTESDIPMENPHPTKNMILSYPSNLQSRHQPTMSSCTELTAPSMKTTHSSNGSFYGEAGNADQPSYSFTATTPEPYMGMTDAMPFPDWISKNLSFVTETEDTPSLSSSSFDFTNALKDEYPSWEDMPYQPSNFVCSADRKDFPQAFEPQYLAEISSVSWPSWPSWPPSNSEQLLPSYFEDRIPTFPGYQTSSWQEKANDQTKGVVKSSPASFDHLQPLANEMVHSMPMTSSTSCSVPVTSPIAISVPIYQASEIPFENYNIQPSTNESSNTLTSLHPLTRNIDSQAPIVETPFQTHQHQYQTSQPQPQAQSHSHSQTQPQSRFTPPTRLEASLHHIDRSNAFLIDCKRRGLSYKDIKRIGNFKEAESTLRGRFRTLTKSKEQRVRKPIWLEKDIQLLCRAVGICEKAGSESLDEDDMGWASDMLEGHCQYPRRNANQPPKVSWKKVAGYISKHGGSYQFGNATCKKKWCEIHNIPI